MELTDADKKLLTLESALLCNSDLLLNLPMNLLAPYFLSVSEIEGIRESINEVNDCNLSSVHHDAMERVTTQSGSYSVYIALFKAYGREFAIANGSRDNDSVMNTFSQIASAKSSNLAAKAAQAVAYYELWQNLFGNTLMAFLNGTLRGKRRSEQNIIFEICYFLYFFPLYLLLAIYYTILQIVPICCLPSFFYILTFLITSVIEVSYALPICIVGLTFRSFLIDDRSRLVLDPRTASGSRSGYSAIGSNETHFTVIQFMKPRQQIKVGLRFGSDRNGNLMISNIKVDSIASASGLRIGDLVKSINSTDMQNSPPRDAANKLMQSVGEVRMEVSHSSILMEYDESTV